MEIEWGDNLYEVLAVAQRLAKRQSRTVILSEQMLHGLLEKGEGTVCGSVRGRGIDAVAVSRVERESANGLDVVRTNGYAMEEDVYLLLSLARDIAVRRGEHIVTADHLMIAMAQSPVTEAGRILRELGVSAPALEASLGSSQMQAAGGGGADQPSTPAPASSESRPVAVPSRRVAPPVPLVADPNLPFTVDFTKRAQEGKLIPVVGRKREIQRAINVLTRDEKSNAVLIGDPGVGKTVMVEGIAQRIVDGRVPPELEGCRILYLDLGGMIAGTRFRGDFEERLKKVLDKVKESNGKLILFIDELHTVVGAGGAEGAMDAANILKPMLARGEIRVIGATTLDEYRKYIEKDAALERRFQPVRLAEPSVDDTIKILKLSRRPKLERHYRILSITEGAVRAAAELSDRYITDRFLPDKAIDLLDETCADVRNRARKLEGRSRKIRITAADVAKTVSLWTGVPVNNVSASEMESLVHLEDRLGERVFGQDEAVQAVAESVRSARLGFADPEKPSGRFVFLGPSGTGKTELSRTLADTLGVKLIRLDMGEFSEAGSVTRLYGASPSFVGHEEGGHLTEEVDRNQNAVVLFDELDKAHPDVVNAVLAMLDNGVMTDGKGREVNFRNTTVIITGNFGSRDLEKIENAIGFARETDPDKRQTEEIRKNFKAATPPEFRRRVDKVVFFKNLSRETLTRIAHKELDKRLADVSRRRNFTVAVDDRVYEALADHPLRKDTQGAGHVGKAITEEVVGPLALQVAAKLAAERRDRFRQPETFHLGVDATGHITVSDTPPLTLTPAGKGARRPKGRPGMGGVAAA